MRSIVVLAGLLLLPAAHAQEVYRWVDKDGVVHYSDQPGDPAAKPVRVAVPNAAEPAAADEPGARAEPAADAGPADRAFEYRAFTLESPQPDQSFQGGNIPVSLALDGDLSPAHSVVLFLDGQRVAGFSGLSGSLSNVARGTHFLRAAILDAAGQPVITTGQITFHVRQASVLTPPVGPTLRPPPPKPPGPTPKKN